MLFECFNINVAALYIIGISVIEFFGVEKIISLLSIAFI